MDNADDAILAINSRIKGIYEIDWLISADAQKW
jgi:hypothetical protein